MEWTERSRASNDTSNSNHSCLLPVSTVPLARERHQPLERARVAPHAREAVGEDSARQELAELRLHEFRQACTGGSAGGVRGEGPPVLADDRVEGGRQL